MTALPWGRFRQPILHISLVGSVIESDDLKRQLFVDNYPSQEKLHCLGHVEAKSMKDFFGCVLHARGDAHL
jgi:hypothetical protein